MAVLPRGAGGAPVGQPGEVLVGDSYIESGYDSNAAGAAEAFTTTASGSGTIASLHLYIDAGTSASTIIVGLYADDGGQPGSLLTQGTITSPKADTWNIAAPRQYRRRHLLLDRRTRSDRSGHNRLPRTLLRRTHQLQNERPNRPIRTPRHLDQRCELRRRTNLRDCQQVAPASHLLP